jgi:hypothetical protein
MVALGHQRSLGACEVVFDMAEPADNLGVFVEPATASVVLSFDLDAPLLELRELGLELRPVRSGQCLGPGVDLVELAVELAQAPLGRPSLAAVRGVDAPRGSRAPLFEVSADAGDLAHRGTSPVPRSLFEVGQRSAGLSDGRSGVVELVGNIGGHRLLDGVACSARKREWRNTSRMSSGTAWSCSAVIGSVTGVPVSIAQRWRRSSAQPRLRSSAAWVMSSATT